MNPKDRIGLTKSPLHLVPPALAITVAPPMADGAAKYGAYNWRDEAVSLSVYLAAALRHIYAFMDGEDNAPDSGHDHLAHAAACMAIIFDARSIGQLIDDRPTRGAAAELIRSQTVRGDEPAVDDESTIASLFAPKCDHGTPLDVACIYCYVGRATRPHD